jgi:outer membrane receptor protein involved in Fe transport
VLCHCRAGRAQGAARILFGNIGHIGETFTFELVLVDARSCAVAGSVFVSESHDLGSARTRLGSLVGRLVTPQESVSETVVKDERDVDAVPAIVTVFTGQQMRQLGIRRLSELLKFVPGFEAIDTNWGDIVLHHGLEETILFLMDGIPLSNPMYNFRDLGRDFALRLGHLDRVEFVRGPGSVLYGANAFLGMINFITHMPTSDSPEVSAEASFGTLSTVDFYASVEQSHRWFRYHVSASFEGTRGAASLVPHSPYGYLTLEQPVWGNSGSTDNAMDLYYDIMARLEILKRLQLGVSVVDHRNHFEISPFGSLLQPDQGGAWYKWHRLYSLAWEENLRRGFKLRLAGSRYEYRMWEDYVIHPANPQAYPAGLRALQGNEVDPQVSHLVEARLYHSYQGRRLGNRFLLGASYLHQSIPDMYASLVGIKEQPPLELDFAQKRFHTASAFLQDDFSLWDSLVISGGLRLEYRDPFGAVLLGQGGFILRQRHYNAKLVYAEGFRPPLANYLYSTVGTEGNLELRPERSRALSLEAGTRLGPFWARAGGTVAWVTDLIVLDSVNHSPGFASKPFNKASTTIVSGYGEAGLELTPLLGLFANYNVKKLWEKETPTEHGTAVAPHTASLGLSLRPFDDLAIWATGHLTSPRTVPVLMPSGGVALQRIGVAADFSLGVWLTNLFRRFEVGLKVQNPLGLAHRSAYRLDGNANYLLEQRRVTEVLLTLRFSSSIAAGAAPPTPTPSPSPSPSPSPHPASTSLPSGAP